MTDKLNAQIASLPDRENVVYEIYLGADQVAEVSNEPDVGMLIEIFSNPSGTGWIFDFNEFKYLVQQAENNLMK